MTVVYSLCLFSSVDSLEEGSVKKLLLCMLKDITDFRLITECSWHISNAHVDSGVYNCMPAMRIPHAAGMYHVTLVIVICAVLFIDLFCK